VDTLLLVVVVVLVLVVLVLLVLLVLLLVVLVLVVLVLLLLGISEPPTGLIWSATHRFFPLATASRSDRPAAYVVNCTGYYPS
jgi:hypothetical protein